MVSIPIVKFYNDVESPILGLGTWESKPNEVTQAVKDAIDAGYRLFDCAHVFGNETEVGEGLAAKIEEGVVKREDLFITSKLWNTYHRRDLVEIAIRNSLANLGLEYLDMYLIHWPTAYKEGPKLFPKDSDGKIIYSEVDYLDTWLEMETLVGLGLTRSIGVANFNIEQIDRLLDNCNISPVTNQVEVHPYLNQKKLISHCVSRGITITAYSPLSSPDNPWVEPSEFKLLDDPKIMALAEKYKKTSAQIVLRYHVQRGCITIPKSVTKERIEQNINIFDFELSSEDIAHIDTLDCNKRICTLTEANTHKHYPFSDLQQCLNLDKACVEAKHL